MPFQIEPGEQRARIDRPNLVSRFSRENNQQHRDQATHDVRVAVGDEDHAFSIGLVRFGDHPDLGNTALNLGFRRLRLLRHLRQSPAEIDDVAVTLFPVAEKLEVLDELIEINLQISL